LRELKRATSCGSSSATRQTRRAARDGRIRGGKAGGRLRQTVGPTMVWLGGLLSGEEERGEAEGRTTRCLSVGDLGQLESSPPRRLGCLLSPLLPAKYAAQAPCRYRCPRAPGCPRRNRGGQEGVGKAKGQNRQRTRRGPRRAHPRRWSCESPPSHLGR
jgi:hypothetical protein